MHDDAEELASELGATASPERVSDDLSIQDTLVSLLGAVKTLTAGLEEVKAHNRQLRSLVEGKQDGLSAVASPPLVVMALMSPQRPHSLLEW